MAAFQFGCRPDFGAETALANTTDLSEVLVRPGYGQHKSLDGSASCLDVGPRRSSFVLSHGAFKTKSSIGFYLVCHT